MIMKLKKAVAASFIMSLALFGTAGCSSNGKEGKVIELTLATNQYQTQPAYIKLKELAEAYTEKNPNVKVNVSILEDYEASMKIQMASNDLPDLFFTHGWSVARYAEYLEPLQNEPWAKNLNPLIKERITAEDGSIYVMPMDVTIVGIAFNEAVLKEAGVDYKAIKTVADFKKACEKVKAKGKTPLEIGGLQDSWTVAQFMDYMLPAYMLDDSAHDYGKALLDGDFNWDNFSDFYDMFMNFYDSGYFNADVREGSNQGMIEGIAHNEAAFAFSSAEITRQVAEIDDHAKIGLMPIPVAYEGNAPYMITGEDVAIGTWKDSPHKEEAIKFLEYLAQPENVNAIAATSISPTGIVGDEYKTDAGEMNQYYSEILKCPTYGYFDRDYLPSGMWDTLSKAGEAMINKTSKKKEIIEKMQADYDKLMKQAQ